MTETARQNSNPHAPPFQGGEIRRGAFLALLAFSAALCCNSLYAENAGAAAHPSVRIETSLGDIDLELYADQAPETVRNFLAYVSEKFYDGTVFHRVAQGIVIQGGGFTPDMKEKSPNAARPPVKNEATTALKNTRGTISMARSADPDSATCQFFINTGDNVALNHLNATPQGMGYCVFGRVIAGQDVVDKINAVAVDKGEKKSEPKLFLRDGSEVPSAEIPKVPVLIKSIRELPAK